MNPCGNARLLGSVRWFARKMWTPLARSNKRKPLAHLTLSNLCSCHGGRDETLHPTYFPLVVDKKDQLHSVCVAGVNQRFHLGVPPCVSRATIAFGSRHG